MVTPFEMTKSNAMFMSLVVNMLTKTKYFKHSIELLIVWVVCYAHMHIHVTGNDLRVKLSAYN